MENPNPLLSIDAELTSRGITPNPRQRMQIGGFVELLEQWNARINLTGTRERTALLHRHILDCLMLETIPRPAGLTRWLDVGSGAGLPGLLIAIMHPDYQVSAVEKVAKKATFQQHAARSLGVNNFTVIRGDVWTLADKECALAGMDGLVARAFAELPVLLELSARFLRPGGQLWAMKGRRWAEELKRVPPALMKPYAEGPEHYSYQLTGGSGPGVVLIWRLREEPTGA